MTAERPFHITVTGMTAVSANPRLPVKITVKNGPPWNVTA